MNNGFRSWARPRHKVFVGDPQTIDTTNGNTFRHGFGRRPGNVVATLLCVTSNNGYVAGEEIPISLIVRNTSTADDGAPRWSLHWDASKVVARIASASTAIIPSSGAAAGTFTSTEWKMVVRCSDIERLK